MGFIGYYRGFLPDIAGLTHEMNGMKNGATLQWTPEVLAKFEQLKARFREQPMRGYPDYSNPEPFVLDSDWSATNMAAVLSQVQGGKETFFGVCTRKCNKAEQNYPSHKGELVAPVMGMWKFEHILQFKPFILRTNSKCMSFLSTLKEVRGIYARWLTFLQGFNFIVQHRPGAKKVNADVLSRLNALANADSNMGDEERADWAEDV